MHQKLHTPSPPVIRPPPPLLLPSESFIYSFHIIMCKQVAAPSPCSTPHPALSLGETIDELLMTFAPVFLFAFGSGAALSDTSTSGLSAQLRPDTLRGSHIVAGCSSCVTAGNIFQMQVFIYWSWAGIALLCQSSETHTHTHTQAAAMCLILCVSEWRNVP